MTVFNCSRIIEQRKHYYYDRGMKLFNNKNYINAAKEFEKALQLDASYLDAHYMRGMCFYSMGDYQTARASFQYVLDERKEDITLKLKVGECYLKAVGARGKRHEGPTRVYFIDVISPLAEKNRDARILLLKFYVGFNNMFEAEKIIDGFLRDGEKSADFYTALVQYNLKRNKIAEAEAIALQHFSYTPDWIKTMQLIIQQLESEKNYGALEKIYIMMIDQAEDKLPYQQKLVNIYRSQGNVEMEGMLFKKMLQSYPDDLQLKLEYMNFLVRDNKKGDAESFLNEEIKKQPENMQLKKMLIDLFVQSGQTKKAYQQTEEMLRALPKDTSNYIEFQNILAELYFKSGEIGKAKINAEEILNKYPRDRDARFLLCKTYIQEGRALPAIGELRQLTNENPSVAEFSYNLGLAHELRGENALAEKAFRTALDISPDYKDALLKWIAIYPKKGSLSEAELKIRKYLDIHPDDTEIKTLHQTIQEQKTGIITSANVSEK
jgi:tetratricopeptide (TPR) repeat protein